MAARASLPDIGRVTDSALQGASVLLVEDELLLRKQVAAALEQHRASAARSRQFSQPSAQCMSILRGLASPRCSGLGLPRRKSPRDGDG